MRKLTIASMLALAVSGCGLIPSTTSATPNSAAGAQSAPTLDSLYGIMDVSGQSSSSVDPSQATDSVPTGPATGPIATGQASDSAVGVQASGSAAPKGFGGNHLRPSGSAKSASPAAQLLFALLDVDGDGKISPDELSSAIKARNAAYSDAQISALFQKLDANHDGFIELAELGAPSQPQQSAKSDRPNQGGRFKKGCRAGWQNGDDRNDRDDRDGRGDRDYQKGMGGHMTTQHPSPGGGQQGGNRDQALPEPQVSWK